MRKYLLGNRGRLGLLPHLALYAVLIAIGFVYLYPLLYMVVTSLKSPLDLLSPLVEWVPTELYWGNYARAVRVLGYGRALGASALMSIVPSLLQAAVTSLVGYGLARYRFRGRALVWLLILLTFIIPPQTTFIPLMLRYRELGLLGSPLALILPAALGQGYRSAIFVLIFYLAFRSLPQALEESARLDGASELRIFASIAIPSALAAYIVALVFSVVWYWNETFLTGIFLEGGAATLPLRLAQFAQAYERLYPPGVVNPFERLNEAVRMSGTMLNILPPLVMYFILQRWFVESLERTGVTGE